MPTTHTPLYESADWQQFREALLAEIEPDARLVLEAPTLHIHYSGGEEGDIHLPGCYERIFNYSPPNLGVACELPRIDTLTSAWCFSCRDDFKLVADTQASAALEEASSVAFLLRLRDGARENADIGNLGVWLTKLSWAAHGHRAPIFRASRALYEAQRFESANLIAGLDLSELDPGAENPTYDYKKGLKLQPIAAALAASSERVPTLISLPYSSVLEDAVYLVYAGQLLMRTQAFEIVALPPLENPVLRDLLPGAIELTEMSVGSFSPEKIPVEEYTLALQLYNATFVEPAENYNGHDADPALWQECRETARQAIQVPVYC